MKEPDVSIDDHFEAQMITPEPDRGTSPGDRKFRPDVQGLRAIAILLVVLFHAGLPGLPGGFVGVDVFFVISGFVITGLLLRQSENEKRISIIGFYARRARRIIPAATLVIVVTVVASSVALGPAVSWQAAVDGQWASVFLANFHFIATSTNYLSSEALPSPLQNFWSLAVEEQFYLVFPVLFLLAVVCGARRFLRLRLGMLLGITIVVSYALSISVTTNNAAASFFSPFTRAWELALGGLIAVLGEFLAHLPKRLCAAATWIGLGLVIFAGTVFTASTTYPGSLVAVPVVGAGLIIAGGTSVPRWGVEWILKIRPLQWIGLISYAWYLWHWPILTIAAEYERKASLGLGENLGLVLLALGLAVVTLKMIENPIRFSTWLKARPVISVVVGIALVISSLVVSTAIVHTNQRGHAAYDYARGIADSPFGSACIPPPSSELASLQRSYRTTPFFSTAASSLVPTRIMVAGDSAACSMLAGMTVVGSHLNVKVENAAVISCGIVSGLLSPYIYGGFNLNQNSGDCTEKAEKTESSVMKRSRPNIIVWSSTWERNSIEVNSKNGILQLKQGSPQWRAVLLGRMHTRIEQFLKSGAKVVILQQAPFVDKDPAGKPSAADRSFMDLNSLLAKASEGFSSRVSIVNLSTRLCPGGAPCPYELDGIALRPDDDHLSPQGSLWLAEWLMPQIISAADHS